MPASRFNSWVVSWTKKPQPNPGVANPYIWDLGQRKRNKEKEWQGKIILGKALLF